MSSSRALLWVSVLASVFLLSACGSDDATDENSFQENQAFVDSFSEDAMDKISIWSEEGIAKLQQAGVNVVEKSPTGSYSSDCPFYGPDSFTTECVITPKYRDVTGATSESTFYFDVDYTDFDECWTGQVKRIIDGSGYENRLVQFFAGVELSGCIGSGEEGDDGDEPKETGSGVEPTKDPGFTVPERHVPPGTANCGPGYVVVGNEDSEMCVAG